MNALRWVVILLMTGFSILSCSGGGGRPPRDNTAPAIVSVQPKAEVVGSRQLIEVTFSEPVDPDSLVLQIDKPSADGIEKIWSADHLRVSLIPLEGNHWHDLGIDMTLEVNDLQGNLLSPPYEIVYLVDRVAPSVVMPQAHSRIGDQQAITLEFSESVDQSSLEFLSGSLAGETGTLNWQVVGEGMHLSIHPKSTWPPGREHDLKFSIADVFGNTLENTFFADVNTVYVSGGDNDASDLGKGLEDTPFATLQAAIDYGKKVFGRAHVLVASAVYNVGDGHAQAFINLPEGIHLYGGYAFSATTGKAIWPIRKPDLYVTEIINTNVSAGTAAIPNPAVIAENAPSADTAPVIDGFTLRGGGGDYSAGLVVNNSALTVNNSVISGGDTTQVSYGVLADNAAAQVLSLSNSQIEAGNSRLSMAVYLDAGSVNFHGNEFKSGQTTLNAYGVIIHGNGQIYNNRIINGTSGAGGGQGLSLNPGDGSKSLVYNNVIYGGDSVNVATGLLLNLSGGSPVIQVYNNTINGGDRLNPADTPMVAALSIQASTANNAAVFIENNLLLTRGGDTRFCVRENGDDTDPKSVRNNNLIKCPTALYGDYAGIGLGSNGSHDFYTTIDAVNDFNNTTQNGAYPSEANKAANTVFVAEADHDYHLVYRLIPAATSLEVIRGGLDLSAHFTTDKDGKTRTIPWSIGAYEHEGLVKQPIPIPIPQPLPL